MVVYLDSLFLLNLGVDGLLLSAARRLSRSGGSWQSTLAAAGLGALYAAALIALPRQWMGHPLVRVAVAVLMAWICTGGGGRTGALLGLFLLLSLSLGGGVLLLSLAGLGRMSSAAGVPVTLSDAQLLLLCAAGEYLLCSTVTALTRRSGSATVLLLLRCQGRRVLLRGLVDSGNLLRDPLTGKSVVVVSREAASNLFPPDLCPTAEELRRPEEVCARLAGEWEPGRVRLLPYHAVGTEQGLLLAVRLDALEVNGKRYPNRLAALSPSPLAGGGQAIIGTEEGGFV
jgi:stage II sporulation protein GA (sporulation sigma-E factor processing peptidase)